MNKSRQDRPGQGVPDQGYDEHEWQAQERALREARDGVEASSDDIALAHYRRVARALRQPPQAALPADFAVHVASLAGGRHAVERTIAKRATAGVEGAVFEQALVRILSVAFALSALAALAIYGARLLAMLQATIGDQGLQWMLVLGACAGLTWVFEWMRRRWGHDDDGPMRTA